MDVRGTLSRLEQLRVGGPKPATENNNPSPNTPSGVSLLSLAAPASPMLASARALNLTHLANRMATEFGIPLYAASLVSEYALHSLEKTLSPGGIVRPAVEQRMAVIRNERFPQRGLPVQALDAIDRMVATNRGAFELAGMGNPESQQDIIMERLIKPSIQIAMSLGVSLQGLVIAGSLLGTFQALDPLRYGLGSDGPSLEAQYGVARPRGRRGSREAQPLASRSGSMLGREDREFRGQIDCSGYVVQATRSIAVDVMMKKGESREAAVQKAKANVSDIDTATMLSQARRDKIGGLPKCPSAEQLRVAYREGRIELGDALVVPPAPRKRYGHAGMLVLKEDGRLVVHESASGRGVIERSLEEWASLGARRGELRIFRHNFLEQLGVFDGKPILKLPGNRANT